MRSATLRKVYRAFARRVLRIPGVRWVLVFIDPLYLANLLLYQALRRNNHHAEGRLLDLGCGDKPYRDLFSHVRQYVGVDLSPDDSVDVIADGLCLPFRDCSFDTVLCNEVLEHVPGPLVLMSEAFRVLSPGGHLILTTPQTWGLHRVPHDYYRYTEYGLRHLAERAGFEVLAVRPTSGLWATIAQRISDTVVNTYAARSSFVVERLLTLLVAPVQILGFAIDVIIGSRGDTLDNLLIARRPL